MSSSHLVSLPWLKQVIDTIIAGVLHDVVDDTGRDLRDVREHFGDEVAKLVAGVSKLSNINQVQDYFDSYNFCVQEIGGDNCS